MSEETITLPVEPHWAGDYRLVTDGKYYSLYGLDRNYPLFDYRHGRYFENEFDESVLYPCIIEGRDIYAEIVEVTNAEIKIKLTYP